MPTVYKSSDASAPVLNGVAGSLISVLDACLVNGYTGKTAAGWAKPYSGTNLAAYRAATGAMQYLRVDDSAPNTASLGREARVCGYETMTAISTGTGLFPTTAQSANGLFVRKASYASATAVPWVIVADAKTFYMFIAAPEFVGYSAFMFGEFCSLGGGSDAYRSILIARNVEQVSTANGVSVADDNLNDLAVFTANIAGHYTPRSFAGGLQLAQNVGKHGNAAHSAVTLAGIAPYPNPVDGGLYLSQVWLHEVPATGANSVLRGRLRGFWHFLHPVGSAVGDGDTWSGTGALAGKTFLSIKPTADGAGVFVMETSNTWEVN